MPKHHSKTTNKQTNANLECLVTQVHSLEPTKKPDVVMVACDLSTPGARSEGGTGGLTEASGAATQGQQRSSRDQRNPASGREKERPDP